MCSLSGVSDRGSQTEREAQRSSQGLKRILGTGSRGPTTRRLTPAAGPLSGDYIVLVG